MPALVRSRASHSRPFRQTCMVKGNQVCRRTCINPELGMDEAMIQMQALGAFALNGDLLRRPVAADAQRGAGLDGLQHADQALVDLVALGDLGSDILLANLGIIDVFDLAASLACVLRGFVNELPGDLLGVFAEVGHRHTSAVQMASSVRAGIDDASQESAKAQAIDSGQDTQDTLSELTYNRLHGVAPDARCRTETPATTIGATPFKINRAPVAWRPAGAYRISRPAKQSRALLQSNSARDNRTDGAPKTPEPGSATAPQVLPLDAWSHA